jgi:heme/copper-type cytochrome/quinol oxidase subunit 3
MKFDHHLYPSTSTFLAIYFTMTALHAIHIIGGLIVNGYLWATGAKMFKEDPHHFSHRVEIAGIYWHFVDLLWIILLFPVLYLL